MHLARPLTLPSGRTLRHRLAKAATTEVLADLHDHATTAHARLYERFARGGAALVITGNVMIDARYLERPGNVVLEDESGMDALKAWAQAGQASASVLLMQLNHPGRQTNRLVTDQPVAPSAGDAVNVLNAFARPRALTHAEILDIIGRFARASAWAEAAGFAGVQVHAAHGYLLSQFLSPRTNRRTDAWGGTLENRARILREAVRAIRASTKPGFILSVKLNSADFQRGGFTEEEALEVVRLLAEDGIDLLEISGGNYEAPALFGSEEKASTLAREAYFLEFARRVRAVSRVPLMVTGGFRSRAAMEAALEEDALDLIGLARPLLLEPDLPLRLLSGEQERSELLPLQVRFKALKAIAEGAYFDALLRQLAQGRTPDRKLSLSWALFRYLTRDAERALARRWHRARTQTVPPKLSRGSTA